MASDDLPVPKRLGTKVTNWKRVIGQTPDGLNAPRIVARPFQPGPTKDFLHPTEVARQLKRHVTTVHWYSKTGRLSAVRGRQGDRLFDPVDVAQMAKALQSADRRKRACRFCGRKIPQHQTYCDRLECKRRRARAKTADFNRDFEHTHGFSYKQACQLCRRQRWTTKLFDGRKACAGCAANR